jgi:hypothetical protein
LEKIMVLTLELPVRQRDPHSLYELRFGALPCWLDEVPPDEARALLRLALRRGVPLTPADGLQ